MGATGDGGHFDELADLLADEFTVITYDRRGNGRSPVPAGWRTTSAEEQADDAAALLDALEIGPAAVFGTSSGGTFALCLLVRHAEHVRGAILHEPGLYSLVDDFDAVRAPIRALVEEASEAAGRPPPSSAFWCYIVENDDGWNRLAPSLRERLRATATHVVRGRARDLRVVPAGRQDVGVPFRAGEPARQRGRPSLLCRDSRPSRRTPGRRGRHHARSTRRVSRPPLRVRRGHAAVPPRGHAVGQNGSPQYLSRNITEANPSLGDVAQVAALLAEQSMIMRGLDQIRLRRTAAAGASIRRRGRE